MSTQDQARKGHHPGIALAILVACQLMITLDGTIVNVALPQLRADLGFSRTGLSWVSNGFGLAFGGLLLLGGRVGDVLGRRRIFTYGVIAFVLASAIGGLAQDPGVLLASRALQGAAGAFASSAAMALIISNFPEGPERTKAMGAYAMVSAAGGSVGLVLGGLLIQATSWRWAFYINVPLGIAIVLTVPLYLTETERHPGRFDVIGALSSTVGMSSLVYGLIRAGEKSWSDPLCVGALTLAVVTLLAFVLQERHAEQPIMPLWLFTSRDRAGAYVARAFLVASMYGSFFFLAQYVQEVLGYSPVQNGLAFLPNMVGFFISAKVAGRYLPRWGTRRTALTGLPITAVGLLWLTQVGTDNNYLLHLGLPLLLLGSGIGFPMMALTLASMVGIEARDSGAASGMLNVVQQVGGALGLSILVTVFGTATRHAAAHPKPGLSALDQAHAVFVHGASMAFLTASIFAMLAVVVVGFVIHPMKPSSVTLEPAID